MSHDSRLLISYIAPSAPATSLSCDPKSASRRRGTGRRWESTSASVGTPTRRTGGTRLDLERIVRDYALCDLVLADIEAGTPDERVLQVPAMCAELSRTR